MVFDVERHQENRMKFLAALLEAGGQEYETVIGQKAGLSVEDTDSIGTEMLEQRLVMGESGGPGTGPRLTLEPAGRELIERYLYEKSQLAKRRKAAAWGKEEGGKVALWGSKEAVKWLWAAGGAAAATALAATKWAWLKGLFAGQ
jgi:hypothetical protein